MQIKVHKALDVNTGLQGVTESRVPLLDRQHAQHSNPYQSSELTYSIAGGSAGCRLAAEDVQPAVVYDHAAVASRRRQAAPRGQLDPLQRQLQM